MPKLFALVVTYLTIQVVYSQQIHTIKKIDELIALGHSIKTKNIDSVLLLANNTYAHSRALKYELGIVKAMTLASFYYYDTYRFDTAKFLLHESLQYFDRFPKHQNSIDHGQVFLHLGFIAVKVSDFELAGRYANNALTIFKLNNDHKNIAGTLILLGGIESSQGYYARGLAYYTNALRIKIDNNYQEEKYISDFSNIAGIYVKIGQYEKAIQYSKKALSLARKYKHPTKELISLNTMGIIYSSSKQYDSAIYFYEACLALSKTLNKTENKEIAHYNIANLYHKKGQYPRSNKLVNELIAMKPRLNVLYNAKILQAKNYLKLSRIDSAGLVASSLYHNFNKSIKNIESKIELTYILSETYRLNKKYDSALHYLELNHNLNDSIHNIQNQHKLSQLYSELESIEKEKEIEILKQESLIRKKKNNGIYLILAASVFIIFITSCSALLFLRNKERNTKLLNIELSKQLEIKKRDLHQQALKIIYMNNGLVEIENNLKKLHNQIEKKQSKDIDSMLDTIQNSKTLDTEWENFTKYFDQVYHEFTHKVSARFPNLSTAEKRLVLLIKMELKNREIASLLNIDSASVKMAKYRLKKKLHLPEEIDVQIYLNNFN